MQLIIIGGSDAGISAALRAREMNPDVKITVICKDRFPNFSICGLPFFISGEVTDWRTLAHRTIHEIEEKGIYLLLDHKVEAIHKESKTITIKDQNKNTTNIKFDRLVICTGAVTLRPKINGLEHSGVFSLRWMDEGFALKKFLDEVNPCSAVVIGGGYIGMEMADAFRYRGTKVTVIEYADTILSTLDPDLGIKIQKKLQIHGVEVRTRTPVSAIEKEGKSLLIKCGNGLEVLNSEIVLFAVGVRPDIALASAAGLDIGEHGAIQVNQKMETSAPGIYAAGDCVETWHRLLEKNVYMPLGTTAHKQGIVAGENAAGGNREFQGSLSTQVVKIFDLVAARTGLREPEAKIAGFDPLSADFEGCDHKAYYPGAKRIIVRLTGDRLTGRLLGVQIIGDKESQISKRVDVIAAALYNDMKVSDIPNIDMSYTPPLSSPWDPVQAAAQKWMRQIKMTGNKF